MDKHPNDEFTPKLIAYELHSNHNSIKVYCTRLSKEGRIIKSHRGYYRSINTVFKLDNQNVFYEDLLLHGIKLEYRGPLCNQIYTTPYLMGYNYTLHRHRKNHSLTINEDWEGRTVCLTSHKELIEIWIKSSHKPLNHDDFEHFNHFIKGKFPQIHDSEWTIKQLDIGIDTPLIHLKGISEITLKVFNNMWLSIYQKFDKVRIEARTTQEICLPDCLNAYANFLRTLTNTDIGK